MKFFLGLLIGLVLAIGIAAGAAYFAYGDLRNVGGRDKSNDITKRYDLTDFDKIDVGGVYEIDVAVGGDYSVSVSGAPQEMALVEASVDDGKLTLDRSSGERRRWRDAGLTATISLPSLQEIDVSGVVDGDVTGIDAENFEADLSGVGDLNLSGTCDSLSASVSGVGDLDADDLKCKSVDVDVSGIGDASVYASQSVSASVSGIGSISVSGSPGEVEKDSSFLSSISVK